VNPRRLYRSRSDKPLAGVAGGMARYLDMDPTVVRLLWIASVLFGGVTIFLYIIMAFIVPLEPLGHVAPRPVVGPDGDVVETTAYTAYEASGPDRGSGRGSLALGIVLVVFGSIALAGAVFPGWIASAALGPAFLLALGIAILAVSVTRTSPES